jgi:hypothetical protein
VTGNKTKRSRSLPAAMRRRRRDHPAAPVLLPSAYTRPEPAWRIGHYDGPTGDAARIEWAKYLATGIVAPIYRHPGACLSLLLKAQALDVPVDTARENVHWNTATGKGAVSAQLMAALLRRHRYAFQVVEETDQRVAMVFHQVVNGRRRRLGTVEWTMLEAVAAGLAWRDLWRHYPTDMLWARCLMRGARRYASDVGTGLAYTPEEVDDAAGLVDGSEVHAAVVDILTRAAASNVTADLIKTVLVPEARRKKLLHLDTGDGTTLGWTLGMLWGERRAAAADTAVAGPPTPEPAPAKLLECGCNPETYVLLGGHQPAGVCHANT